MTTESDIEELVSHLRRKRRQGVLVVVAVILSVCLALIGGFVVFVATVLHVHYPHEFVTPLPPDFKLVSSQDLGCGSQTCSHELFIAGANGQSQSELHDEVESFLVNRRGWHLTDGSGCRSGGSDWTIDSTCVQVLLPNPQQVAIHVAEHSNW